MPTPLPDWIRSAREHWRWRGQERPPFAHTPEPGQTSVWDFPRPPRLAPDTREVVLRWGDVEVARTRRAVRVQETSHPPSFYLPWADVARGDMWAASWGDFELVYLFQRPESMARAWAKAAAEMAPGAWLISLEFAVPGRAPAAQLARVFGRSVWIYRIDGRGLNPRATLPISRHSPTADHGSGPHS